MQWGQIKILFIISFLILDIFLLQQFLSKQQQAELGQISTADTEDIETSLENKDITIAEDAIPSETPIVENIISSESQVSEETRSQIESLEEDGRQEIEIINEDLLKSELKEPVEVTEETIIEEVKQVVPFGDQYSFWGWNKDRGVALFFQVANDRTIYFNKGGFLMVRVEEGEITGYAATLLSFNNSENESLDTNQQNTELISPLTAVNKLVEVGLITSGDEVTDMKIGYHSKFNLEHGEESGPQVFSPTWKISVNEDKDLFVNAEIGMIIEANEEDFIGDISNRSGLNIKDVELQTESPSESPSEPKTNNPNSSEESD